MEPDLAARLEEQEKKIDEIYASVERIRKTMLFSTIFQVSLFVLPLIGIAFAIPFLLDIANSIKGSYNGLL